MFKFQDGEQVEMAPEEIAAFLAEQEGMPSEESVIVVYSVDLWSRMTEHEANQVEAAMTTQSVRIQNIFRTASPYRSDHELWPLLEATAVGLFGTDRAAEILAAS